MKRVKTDGKTRNIALSFSDMQSLMQVMEWREYEFSHMKSEALRECVTIATNYYKSLKENNQPLHTPFIGISFKQDQRMKDELEWLKDNLNFSTDQTAIRTSLRITFELLKKVYGNPSEFPQIPQKLVDQAYKRLKSNQPNQNNIKNNNEKNETE